MNTLTDPATDLTAFTVTLCALFGLLFGSFLNVCIVRLPRHESLLKPRSRCIHCGAAIAAYDNIPLLSWLLLRGRCRSCGGGISWRYPLVEAMTAGLFVACYFKFGITVEGLGNGVFCFLLLGLAFTDAETMLLPDTLTLPGIALGVLFAATSAYQDHGHAVLNSSQLTTALYSAFHSVLAATVAAGLLLLTRWLYWTLRHRQGLGLGDVKLLAMMAAWLLLKSTLLAFFLAVVAASVFALGLLAVGTTPNSGGDTPWLNRRLPLGTFLAAAALYCVFFSEETLHWYRSFFPY